MTEVAVPLISKRRQTGQLLQKVQHAFPSLVLLGHGVARLTYEPGSLSTALGVSEVVVSALVIVSFVRSMRPRREERAHGHSSIDWVDIFIGLMLFVEVWAHWHETGHVRRPTLLLAPIMIGLGLAHGKISARSQRRRSLRVSDAGITIGGRFFSTFHARWTDLKEIALSPASARVVLNDGRARAIDLGDLLNAGDVRQALEGARLRINGSSETGSSGTGGERSQQLPRWAVRALDELDKSDRQAREVAGALTNAQLNWRADPGRWSVGQCLEHLYITNQVYLGPIARALDGQPPGFTDDVTPGPFTRYFVRNYIDPETQRAKHKAPGKTRPAHDVLPDILDKFLASNDDVRALVRRASGFDVNRIRFPNPFVSGLRFTTGAGLEIVWRHQRRHLLQAERVRREPGFPAGSEEHT